MTRNESYRQISRGPTPGDVPLSDLPVIELSEQRLTEARKIARQRSESYADIDGGRLHGDQTSQDAHLTGVIGELAVAELYGGSIDREIYEGGDDGYDLLFDGTSIDVKTTQTTALTRPDLIVPTDPAPTADYYYLVHWLEQDSARIVGYASQECVLDRESRCFPGATQNYVIPPTELAIASEHQPPQRVEQQLFFEGELA